MLGNLGAEDAMVVHGEDGLDEITISDGTKVSRWMDGKVENSIISPQDFGLETSELGTIAGCGLEDNAKITLKVLSGENGPRRNVVLMNAAAALLVAGKADSLRDGFDMAAEAIDSKRAMAKLEDVKEVSTKLGK